jgi:hypothetical protein
MKQFYNRKKSGRNTSAVVLRVDLFGAEHEDLHLAFACVRSGRVGGGAFAERARRIDGEPCLLTESTPDS